ncbi:MAG: 50S ribosomal protein L9 [Rhodocyclaceae bacterium]|nr:50S ribosomal protein L9 [Rhodocyclaceae bacterium]MBX3670506.1 50S ribosomal protein L9 [Rhodocyclaceae bacterium]
MQIILMEKIANLGALGDVVKVKDGFARNYLIPQGKAKRVTPASLAEFEQRRAELEKAQADRLSGAQALAEKLGGITLQLTRKAGVDGRLFGSVTNADVADALEKQGMDVSRAMVRMPNGPIKAVGDSQVEVVLHTEVHATVTVTVVGES